MPTKRTTRAADEAHPDGLTDSELQHGYWGARRLAGRLPTRYVAEPEDFNGGDALLLSKAPPLTLSPAQEKKRLARWCQALPGMKLKTVVLELPAPPALFDAVAQVEGLEALYAPNTTVESLAALADCPTLTALEFGSRSVVADLSPLEALPALRHLRLLHLRERTDLAFVSGLTSLREFGFLWNSIDRAPTIDSLAPLATLRHLQLLWLDVKVARDGLRPLQALTALVHLHASFHHPAEQFADIRRALPSLRLGTPFDGASIQRLCKA